VAKQSPNAFIALLRAVNVGGRNLVPMEALRRICESLGLADVRTLLQSGNAVFRSGGRETSAVEAAIEREIERTLHVRTVAFVRTAKQWETIVERNPFPDEARIDPSRLALVLTKRPPAAAALDAFVASVAGPEVVRVEGGQVYVFYANGFGRSRLTIDVIERRMGTPVTARNWNTVVNLGARAQDEPSKCTGAPIMVHEGSEDC
jgi:uncharacterized protein (DUF1697 family)